MSPKLKSHPVSLRSPSFSSTQPPAFQQLALSVTSAPFPPLTATVQTRVSSHQGVATVAAGLHTCPCPRAPPGSSWVCFLEPWFDDATALWRSFRWVIAAPESTVFLPRKACLSPAFNLYTCTILYSLDEGNGLFPLKYCAAFPIRVCVCVCVN